MFSVIFEATTHTLSSLHSNSKSVQLVTPKRETYILFAFLLKHNNQNANVLSFELMM